MDEVGVEGFEWKARDVRFKSRDASQISHDFTKSAFGPRQGLSYPLASLPSFDTIARTPAGPVKKKVARRGSGILEDRYLKPPTMPNLKLSIPGPIVAERDLPNMDKRRDSDYIQSRVDSQNQTEGVRVQRLPTSQVGEANRQRRNNSADPHQTRSSSHALARGQGLKMQSPLEN